LESPTRDQGEIATKWKLPVSGSAASPRSRRTQWTRWLQSQSRFLRKRGAKMGLLILFAASFAPRSEIFALAAPSQSRAQAPFQDAHRTRFSRLSHHRDAILSLSHWIKAQ
jgi:hypothetical protein